MLSVVITAYNEEKNLPRVIGSVSGLADEIVVVDTESSDKTSEVAKKHGAKVFHHKNTTVVEPVRNFSISKAKGDWILLLDADEEVSPTLAQKIRSVIASGDFDYARIPRQNIIFGRWIKSSHWWPDYVYRLFKKGQVVWKDEIHSVPQAYGVGFDFPASPEYSLIHHHYDTISQYITRLNRYTDVEASQIFSAGHKFHWPDLLTKPASEFISQYFSRKGYAQGLHGLVLALLQTFSILATHLKLWQLSGFPEAETSPARVRAVVRPIFKNEFSWWLYETKIQSAKPFFRPIWKLIRKFSLFVESL